MIHFEIFSDKKGRIIKTFELKNAGISIIEYDDINTVAWNESFDLLAKYLEKEIKSGIAYSL